LNIHTKTKELKSKPQNSWLKLTKKKPEQYDIPTNPKIRTSWEWRAEWNEVISYA
jgi:hypothetical protein